MKFWTVTKETLVGENIVCFAQVIWCQLNVGLFAEMDQGRIKRRRGLHPAHGPAVTHMWSRQRGVHNIPQHCRPPWPLTGIALLFFVSFVIVVEYCIEYRSLILKSTHRCEIIGDVGFAIIDQLPIKFSACIRYWGRMGVQWDSTSAIPRL
jgi:hypothetical protein